MAGPRAVWSGSISLGMISIPVKLHTATKTEKKIEFNQLNKETKNRIRQLRVDAGTEKPVEYENVVKGYQVSKDEYIIVNTDELDELLPDKTQNIEIEAFVNKDEIDPVYYDTPYYASSEIGAKPYTLLRKALESTNKVAIGRIVMRTKEYLVSIQPHGEGLAINTLRWAENIRNIEDVTPDEVVIKDKEMDMAIDLVNSMSEEFTPQEFTDEHRARVMELIEQKAQGKELVKPTTTEDTPDAEPEDLFAALEASINSTKKKKTKKKSTKKAS